VSVCALKQIGLHMLSIPELDRCKHDLQGLGVKSTADILLLVGCLRLVAIGRCAKLNLHKVCFSSPFLRAKMDERECV